MKALSIQRPWAHCVMHEGKGWENRTWKTGYRGPLLIHVGKKIDVLAWNMLTTDFKMDLPPVSEMQKGGIIGMVDLVDCLLMADHPEIDSKWLFGPYGFKLANPTPLKFVPLAGKLGLFNVDNALIEDAT